jgi:hypothetical protein
MRVQKKRMPDPDHRFTGTDQRGVTVECRGSTTPQVHTPTRKPETRLQRLAMSLHQRPHQKPPAAGDSLPVSSPTASTAASRPHPLLTLPYLFSLLAVLLFVALLVPWGPAARPPSSSSSWRSYTLQDAAASAAAAGNGTVLLAAVSGPYLPFLSNWLISVRRAGRADQVLVIAEDYETLDRINAAWPGHAVLVPPAPDAQTAHKFGSQVRRKPPLKLFDEMYPCLTAAIVSVCDYRGSSTSPRAVHGTCCRSLSSGTASCTTTSTWCGLPTRSLTSSRITTCTLWTIWLLYVSVVAAFAVGALAGR